MTQLEQAGISKHWRTHKNTLLNVPQVHDTHAIIKGHKATGVVHMTGDTNLSLATDATYAGTATNAVIDMLLITYL